MIPGPEEDLSPVEAARWRLTRLAAAIADEHGVPIAALGADAREGAELGWRRRLRR